jgi:hypothetical protein
MIDQYPYMFLWKPVLISFIKAIDQLAHIKYLEFGKVLDVSYALRRALGSSNNDAFGGLITKCKKLTLFAMISNHSSFKMLLKTVELETKKQKLFNSINLESEVHNFTVGLIKKWVNEYSPTKDEYKLKIDMILAENKQPSKFSTKYVDSFFLSDITSGEFLKDPLTVLSFDHNSIVPYMKSIHYFIELTQNMLNFEENRLKSLSDSSSEKHALSFNDILKSGTNSSKQNIDMNKMINQV